jgi:hypothetical protein
LQVITLLSAINTWSYTFEVQIAVAKLKKYKSPGNDQVPAELIQAGGEIFTNSFS